MPGLVIQAYVHEQRRTFIRAAVVHGRPFYAYVFARMDHWNIHTNALDRNQFVVVPWERISRDNNAGRSEVPMLKKDGMGVVDRSPDSFFNSRETVFDRDPRYFTSHRRDPKLFRI